jgi:DNA processing protein
MMLLLSSGATKSRDPMYRRIGAAVSALGSAEVALNAIPNGDLAWDVDLFVASTIGEARTKATEEVAAWTEAGWRALVLGEEAYPQQLAEMIDAPPLLFVTGAGRILNQPGIAIVGARSASPEGIRRAGKAARILAEAGLVVYSGLARGIDAAAHSGALAVRGLTVAVMGTPIDRRYPAENAGLAEQITAHGGALVTEYAPSEPTKPWNFLRRNRTMSGLALATLVIEASETSGARSQARVALERGRPVFLPQSLVDRHAWARHMIEVGHSGSRAVLVQRPEDIATALASAVSAKSSGAAF